MCCSVVECIVLYCIKVSASSDKCTYLSLQCNVHICLAQSPRESYTRPEGGKGHTRATFGSEKRGGEQKCGYIASNAN